MADGEIITVSKHQSKVDAVMELSGKIGFPAGGVNADVVEQLYELVVQRADPGAPGYFSAEEVRLQQDAGYRLFYPPICFNGKPAHFPQTDLSVPMLSPSPSFRLARIQNGYVGMLYDAPVIYDANFRIEREFSSRYSLLHAYAEERVDLAGAQEIDGDVFVMLDDIGGLNFCHWLCDWTPRLSAARGLSDKLYILTLPIVTEWQKELIAAFGFSPSQCIHLDNWRALKARNVYAPSHLTHIFHPAYKGAPWVYDYLRAHLPGEGGANLGPRVYLSRDDAPARRVLNEDALMDYLAPLGFQKFVASDYGPRDQASIFRHAETVVSLHGAGLTNLIFCKPGAKILELCPERYAIATFWIMAATLDLHYATYICHDYTPAAIMQQDDVTIDVEDFRAKVDAFLRYA